MAPAGLFAPEPHRLGKPRLPLIGLVLASDTGADDLLRHDPALLARIARHARLASSAGAVHLRRADALEAHSPAVSAVDRAVYVVEGDSVAGEGVGGEGG